MRGAGLDAFEGILALWIVTQMRFDLFGRITVESLYCLPNGLFLVLI